MADKHFYSPFYRTTLDRVLGERRIDTVVLTGTETDVCVLAAALDAVDRGCRTIVVSDGICSSSDETHDALMTLYRHRFSNQIEVATAAEVLSAWM